LSTRAEQITSEVKRLVLKCRKLEADLAQSVPKKTLEETTAKMQQRIDALNAELKRANSDLDSATTVNERMDALGKQLEKQSEEISTQYDFIKSIATKMDTMVPSAVYEQATSKIHELEQAFESQSRNYASELESQLENSVPKTEFEELSQTIVSLTKSLPVIDDFQTTTTASVASN
jgi:HPt (histidine-containing phosphotransfer) domain-containing protein